MDDKTRIVRNTEELKGKVQHRALALKDAVADLIPVTKKPEYDLPFTYEICIPEKVVPVSYNCSAISSSAKSMTAPVPSPRHISQ